MALFRKKPIVIEAFQFYVDSMPDWFMDMITENKVVLESCNYKNTTIKGAYCLIKTLEGEMLCKDGDYVIKGVKGECYSCKPDIFLMTYEPVESKKG